MDSVEFHKDALSKESVEMVRLTFNPSSLSDVDLIKFVTAYLITQMQKLPGDRRCASLAITNYEQAAMWAVKALTAGK